MFGTRVKTFQKKLEEHSMTLSSPLPSPDINAPSPNSDSDIELPEENQAAIVNPPKGNDNRVFFNVFFIFPLRQYCFICFCNILF